MSSSSNVHVSFEHPQTYWPWSHSSSGGSGLHMADHAIHMPNYYYYQQQQQQQHLRQQEHHAGDGGGGGYYGYGAYSYSHQQHPHQHHREGMGEREHLFEKPLTPSDVGKLNRLVIPKQHAEKHFPLDGESGEKGLLLSFEDEGGKAWRFRYSYWTSSQSYVLTKGWSRFVKEKRLDAGDVVLFQRRRSDADHLYIGCKRRGDLTTTAPVPAGVSQGSPPGNVSAGGSGGGPWSQVLYGTPRPDMPAAAAAAAAAASYLYMDNSNASLHRGDAADAGHHRHHRHQPQLGGACSVSNASSSSTNSKRLRLFGVNLDLECGTASAESSSSSADAHLLLQHPQRQFSVPTATHHSQRELQYSFRAVMVPEALTGDEERVDSAAGNDSLRVSNQPEPLTW